MTPVVAPEEVVRGEVGKVDFSGWGSLPEWKGHPVYVFRLGRTPRRKNPLLSLLGVAESLSTKPPRLCI